MARLLAFLLDAIVVFLLVRMVLRLVTGGRGLSRRRSAGRGPQAQAPERAGGTLVRDPHCGTYIPESRALHERVGGQTLHFCSAACRDAYRQRA